MEALRALNLALESLGYHNEVITFDSLDAPSTDNFPVKVYYIGIKFFQKSSTLSGGVVKK